MMNIPEIFSIYALFISNVLLLGAATLAILKFQNQLRNSSGLRDIPAGTALQAQCDQSSINQVTEERLTTLQEAVDSFERSNSSLQPVSEKLPFDNAVQMAKAGASIDDLMRTCGLSRGEARLFMRVHSKSAA